MECFDQVLIRYCVRFQYFINLKIISCEKLYICIYRVYKFQHGKQELNNIADPVKIIP